VLCLAGDGGQAQVFLAQKEGQNFVIKAYFPYKKAHEYFERETRVLKKFHSHHIIKMIECFPEGQLCVNNKVEIRQTIVLEFAQRGDLFNMVKMGRLPEDVARTVFLQLLKAIRDLKEAEVAHLDIKM
jgi:serine/threonine protein kinase